MKSHERLVLQAFAAALRTLRKRKGFSQEKLSLEGVSRSHVSDLERGLRDPKLTMLVKLCDLLGIEFVVLAREIERNLGRLNGKARKLES